MHYFYQYLSIIDSSYLLLPTLAAQHHVGVGLGAEAAEFLEEPDHLAALSRLAGLPGGDWLVGS